MNSSVDLRSFVSFSISHSSLSSLFFNLSLCVLSHSLFFNLLLFSVGYITPILCVLSLIHVCVAISLILLYNYDFPLLTCSIMIFIVDFLCMIIFFMVKINEICFEIALSLLVIEL